MHPLLESALRRAADAEVYCLHRTETPVKLDVQGLSAIRTQDTVGAALRLLRDGRLGYATTTDLSHPDRLTEAAWSTAAYGDTSRIAFSEASPNLAPGLQDPALAHLSVERIVDLGEAIRRELMAVGEDVEVEVTVQRTVDRVQIANSAGLDLEESVTLLTIDLEATRTQAGDIFMVGDRICVSSESALSPSLASSRVLRLLEMGKKVVPAPQGSFPVVFTPMGTATVLLPLILGLNGLSAFLGVSPLGDKRGQRILDSRLTIADDARAVHGARAASFDDEGTPTQRTDLINHGQLKSFYYDLRAAEKAGAASTGNGYKGGLFGRRDHRPSPAASVSHLMVEPGPVSPQELIAEIDRGLLVDTVMGLGQGNVNAGDFSNNLSAGFLIENGKIVGRVKNAMISGNVYALLRDHLIGVGNDAEWVFGRLRSPSLAVDRVNISAKN